MYQGKKLSFIAMHHGKDVLPEGFNTSSPTKVHYAFQFMPDFPFVISDLLTSIFSLIYGKCVDYSVYF